MGLSLAQPRLYLDANVFIGAFEGAESIRQLFRGLLRTGLDRPGLLVTSELTLAEVLVGPLRAGETEARLAAEYAAIVADAPGLAVAPVDRETLTAAARVRADWRSGKLPDAIHLATAAVRECTHILSGDQALRYAARRHSGLIPVPPEDLPVFMSEVDANG